MFAKRSKKFTPSKRTEELITVILPTIKDNN